MKRDDWIVLGLIIMLAYAIYAGSRGTVRHAPALGSTRRALRKRRRTAARRRVLGLPWLQAVGILFGIATSAIVATVALATFLR
ncbi:MAG: hypothetical protein EB824_05455 [Thaumarchaeota archaeon S15]|nr:MAG: hypothetical protein EB824_05455 [Thaumarchaeota archaeon S15]